MKKVFLTNYGKFTEKHLSQSLFYIKLQAQDCNFIKKERCRCFPVNFAKLSRTPYLLKTSGRLLLAIPEPFFMATCVSLYNAAGTWMFIQCSIDFHLWTVG